jgi:hypothetical protein
LTVNVYVQYEIHSLLVCALADAPQVVPGSTFDRRCTGCRRAVMIAPSGQRILRDDPAAQVLCVDCFCAHGDGKDATIRPATSLEELRHEIRSARPNYPRYRN